MASKASSVDDEINQLINIIFENIDNKTMYDYFNSDLVLKLKYKYKLNEPSKTIEEVNNEIIQLVRSKLMNKIPSNSDSESYQQKINVVIESLYTQIRAFDEGKTTLRPKKRRRTGGRSRKRTKKRKKTRRNKKKTRRRGYAGGSPKVERIVGFKRGPRKSKYTAIVRHNKTGKKRTIHFGHKDYQQFKDSTPLGYYSYKNHGTKKRKDAYFSRHSGTKKKGAAIKKEFNKSGGKYTAKILSHIYLW
jgi:hypothetical protein